MRAVSSSIVRSAVCIVTFCVLLAVSLPVLAADEFMPVSTEMLKEMLDKKQQFTLIDARTPEEYQEAHIPQAVNVQEKEFDKVSAALPQDKGALLVLYCNGIKCGKSKKVALKAKKAGFTNIFIYGDGFPVWEEKGMPVVAGPAYSKKIATARLSAKELESILREKRDSYVLVDVRDGQEYAEGHIAGAINIPAESFATRSGVLPKEKGIIVYCNSGGRSYMAYRKLMKLAYPSIFQSTLDEWKQAGLPVAVSQP